MHDPRMPFFDMDKPRVAYGTDFVLETFRMMQHVHQAVKVSLEEAQECSKRYYDKIARERTFLQGDKVMVYFPNAPLRINPKFFSHWVPYTVVQMVGKVNAQVRNNETGKSSIIHLDRIRELRKNWRRMKRQKECNSISGKTEEFLTPRKMQTSSMKRFGSAEDLQVQRQQF
jgi:hypothetical protein